MATKTGIEERKKSKKELVLPLVPLPKDDEEYNEISFFDYLEREKIPIFNKGSKEVLLKDLGLKIKKLSKEAIHEYKKLAILPPTLFYYEDSKENRDSLGLNHPDLNDVTPNSFLSAKASIQSSKNPFESLLNSNYNKKNIKKADSKPFVIGSNIFAESPESVDINNPNTLFNKVLAELNKKNPDIRRELRAAAAERRMEIKGGDRWDDFIVRLRQIKSLENTTSLNNHLERFYWFALHRNNNSNLKIKQFINSYGFNLHYQDTNDYFRQTGDTVVPTEINISLISNLSEVIPSQESETVLYATSFTRLQYQTVVEQKQHWAPTRAVVYIALAIKSAIWSENWGPPSDIVTEEKNITYVNMNSTSRQPIFFSDIDKKHLLFSIFFKIILDSEDVEFTNLLKFFVLQHIPIEEWKYITDEMLKTKRNLRSNKLFGTNSIPYFIVKELLVINDYGTIEIITTINDIGETLFTISEEIERDNGDKTTVYTNYADKWSYLLNNMYNYFLDSTGMLREGEINTHTNIENKKNIFNLEHVNRDHRRPQFIDIPKSSGTYSNVVEYSYISTFPPLTFIPDTLRTTGYGIIKDKNQNCLLIEGDNKQILNTDTLQRSQLTEAYKKNLDYSYGFKESRLDSREKILGYLCQLVYYPNDVVKKISDKIFRTISDNAIRARRVSKQNIRESFIVYLGCFDEDPSFPRAFTNGIENEPTSSYDRIHAWLYINNSDANVNGDNGNRYAELFIINRGSRTSLDWEDIDKCIVDGTALFNKRVIEYDNVLFKILDKLNEVLENVDVTDLIRYPTPEKNTTFANIFRRLKIYSSGHSLGGFLGLYFSYMSISRDVIKGYSNTKIISLPDTVPAFTNTNKWFIDRYIVPIVFQPFVLNKTIMDEFLKLPYGIVLSVHGERPTFLYSIIVGDDPYYESAYTDPASAAFMRKLSSRHSGIKLKTYQNIFLHPTIKLLPILSVNYYSGLEGIKQGHMLNRRHINIKTLSDAHSLDQLNGLSLLYLIENTNSDMYIIYERNQVNVHISLDSTKTTINLPLNDDGTKKDIKQYSTVSRVPENILNYYEQAEEIVRGSIDEFLGAGAGAGAHGGKRIRITKKNRSKIQKRKSRRWVKFA
jgi:hypothetical protein